MENINLDILLGLPFQTPDSLKATLERIEELAVEHVSTYMLDLDEPCALAESVADGTVQTAGDDATAEMYLEAGRFLSGLGFRQYEISNYARDGYACRHNMKYWRLDPVIGFGLGSHSFDGISRSANLKDMQRYLRAVQQGRLPVEWSKTLGAHEILQERLFLGLRMNEGVDWKKLEGEFPADVLEEYQGRLARFKREGLVRWEKSKVSLTLSGMLLSNEIFQELV
jgi:oxygen-independent coproporphyrinogen-3 oxidase